MVDGQLRISEAGSSVGREQTRSEFFVCLSNSLLECSDGAGSRRSLGGDSFPRGIPGTPEKDEGPKNAAEHSWSSTVIESPELSQRR